MPFTRIYLVLSLDTWSDQNQVLQFITLWRLRPIMRMEIHSPLSSISAFSTELKRMQTPQSLLRDFGAYKSSLSTLFNSLFRLQSSSLSPSSSESSPCRSYGNHFRRLSWFQKTIKGFDCKVNGRALGADAAEFWHSLGVSDGRALAFPNRLQLLLAVTGLQTVRLLRVTNSYDTDLVRESKRF